MLPVNSTPRWTRGSEEAPARLLGTMGARTVIGYRQPNHTTKIEVVNTRTGKSCFEFSVPFRVQNMVMTGQLITLTGQQVRSSDSVPMLSRYSTKGVHQLSFENAAALTTTGRQEIITATMEGSIQSWPPHMGSYDVYPIPFDRYPQLQEIPGGVAIYTHRGSDLGDVYVWNAEKKSYYCLKSTQSVETVVALDPKTLMICREEETTLYDIDTGNLLHTLDPKIAIRACLVLDDDRFITAASDGTVSLWTRGEQGYTTAWNTPIAIQHSVKPIAIQRLNDKEIVLSTNTTPYMILDIATGATKRIESEAPFNPRPEITASSNMLTVQRTHTVASYCLGKRTRDG